MSPALCPLSILLGTTSFSIYTGTKSTLLANNILASGSLRDIGAASFLAGCTSGALITAGSCPFELVKVRRQLEVMIAQEMGVRDPVPLSTRASIQAIVKMRGWSGMYTGFGAHSSQSRLDTLPAPWYLTIY